MTLDTLMANETTAKAVLYNFIIVGEASSNVPLALQARYPDIP
ncbi:HepT-like ribonuclease domain-containing protein [Thermoleptolyngbya sp.]